MRSGLWNPQYHQIILATDPIAYWPQDEKQGAIAYDWVRRRQGSDQDGVYTGVTLGQPGIGDGRTSPFFDGVNDFNDTFTAAFQGRFDGSEGTMMAWARVFNVGVWTDSISRFMMRLELDAGIYIHIAKRGVNNQLQFIRRGGGVISIVDDAGHAETDWMHLAITWSESILPTGEMRAFFNGVQVGGTQVGLGAWIGNITLALIGALTVVPTNVWHGYIAHSAVFGRAVPPAEILHLYEEAFV